MTVEKASSSPDYFGLNALKKATPALLLAHGARCLATSYVFNSMSTSPKVLLFPFENYKLSSTNWSWANKILDIATYLDAKFTNLFILDTPVNYMNRESVNCGAVAAKVFSWAKTMNFHKNQLFLRFFNYYCNGGSSPSYRYASQGALCIGAALAWAYIKHLKSQGENQKSSEDTKAIQKPTRQDQLPQGPTKKELLEAKLKAIKIKKIQLLQKRLLHIQQTSTSHKPLYSAVLRG